jgi:drug/metabolite transporter (DMT)-like permease
MSVADLVVKDGIGYKRRNPWGVVGLSFLTIGVYFFVWYYKINNELNNYGIQNNPTNATLAVTLGALIIVPAFVSEYNTADRILKAQEKAEAKERMIPVLGLVLAIFFGGFHAAYYQSQLNKVWDAEAARGAEVRAA